ncbi:MAG: NAD(P)/FAD-dependent oxidoreductase, partial [Gaiellaceae bacterium MAG52_C11]|nr:NAD(P)/FAD-dependent oxidoreductase [Candidatus Gaiellasilicea maunaloa]
MSANTYDVIVIGAGHNGLVASFYFAKQGLKTLVLERREIVGGACVTEEFAPGFRASPAAYVLSMLRPAIWRDMELEQRGLSISAAGPTLNVFPDGGHLYLHERADLKSEEIGRFSKRDARRFAQFEEGLADVAPVVMGFYDRPPPQPDARRRRDLASLASLSFTSLRHRSELAHLAYLFSTSMAQYLDGHFESEALKASLGWECISNTLAGPSTPGTAFVLLHDVASAASGGAGRQWGFVPGGMGVVTQLMADAARQQGVEIRLAQEVKEITTANGRATGVILVGDEEITASAVVSNADPKRTFLNLLDSSALSEDFRSAVEAYRCTGASMKINLALAELPYINGLPKDGVQPYHHGLTQITSPLEKLDADQESARRGVPVLDPHMEICFPTVHDPNLAPPGRHVLTIGARSQPYALRDASWKTLRDGAADAVIRHLTQFMPDLPSLILDREVLSPKDLETRFALTGGHHLHGDMAPDQLLFLRPVRGCAGYRTPIRSLYLCGAGTHPGGGVTGANGRNCALDIGPEI